MGSDAQAAKLQLEAAEQIAAMWQGGPWAAEVQEARALIVRARGEVDEAAVQLDEAAALYTDAGFTLHAARCRAAIEAA